MTDTTSSLNQTTGFSTWQLTGCLRYYKTVLQQAWKCLETGEIEWRNIPKAEDTE